MKETLLSLEHLSIDDQIKGGYLSAVNDVCMDIRQGEIFAVVGEFGCSPGETRK